MEVVARYATNRVRTKESLHLKTVATVFKSGVMRFLDGFLWGAATAAHQIEGNNVNNDWWRAEEAGLGQGCGFGPRIRPGPVAASAQPKVDGGPEAALRPVPVPRRPST